MASILVVGSDPHERALIERALRPLFAKGVRAGLQVELVRAAHGAHVVVIGEPCGEACAEISAHLRRPLRAYEVAALAKTLLLERGRENDYIRKQAMLATAQRVGSFGHWHWHPDTGQVSWDQPMAALFGLHVPQIDAQIDHFWQRVHADDRSPRVHG